jgi:hypothetical protein
MSPNGVTIKKGRYRLIRYKTGHERLFDIETDWWQLRPLGRGHLCFAELDEELRAVCRDYRVEIPQRGVSA